MRRRLRQRQLVVRSRAQGCGKGLAILGPLVFAVSLGSGGRRARKREGDGATPIGIWPIRCVLYRPDRIARPRTAIPVARIRRSDGWCDAAGDRNYNRPVRLPYPASAEQMWRDDGLYDIVVVLGHNDRPRVAGGGSAIFMHLMRPDGAPTAGCVAFRKRHLLHVLRWLGPRASVRIVG